MSAVFPKEVAEQEFERMCRTRRVETDIEEMDEKARESFEGRKRKVVKAIMRGLLVVNDAGDPTYTPPVVGAKPLVFHKLTGAALIAHDKANGHMGAITLTLAECTQTSPSELAKLDAKDYQFCCELVNLFLVE